MAVTLNASTSTGLVQTADTSGIIQLQSNGTTIATISSTGLSTQVGAPAFSVYSSSYASSSANTWTKITWNTEDYDTNNNFASSTFTPTVAGYYQVNATIEFVAIGVAGNIQMAFYKSGSRFIDGPRLQIPAGTNFQTSMSALIYCNGSTDTIEVYGQQSSGTMNIGSNSSTFKFTGAMVRSA